MVNLVEAPQEGHAVDQDVPDIERVIHQQERCRKFKPMRKLQPPNDPPAAPLDHLGERFDDWLFEHAQGGRTQHGGRQISNIPLQLGLGFAPQRPSLLCDQQGRESSHN